MVALFFWRGRLLESIGPVSTLKLTLFLSDTILMEG